MIKVEELMIGDWVMYNPNVFNEDEYEPTKECFPTKINSGEDIDLAIEGCYIPLPLTPEILEKNGFRLKEESDLHEEYIAGDEHCIIALYFYKETIYGVSTLLDCERGFAGGLDRIHKCNLLYVHQLQHALKLCEISKIIDL